MALMGILSGRQRVAETLEAMHRAGVLGAVIPEFGNLYARVLHDLYHIYTVDRHSLAAVRELERLRAGEFKDSNPLLTEVAREVTALPFIFLALVLHDIGKGHGHDHHERGALLTAEVSRRLGLDGEETDLVVFLVRNHLMMSQVAQKGDVDDVRTVEEFARTVGSIDRLKALYLMTFADMRAVAPNVYNNWRDMLLSDLYMRALKILEQGDREAVDPARRLALVKAAVRDRLSPLGAGPEELAAFLDLMPDRYFLTVPEDDIPTAFRTDAGVGRAGAGLPPSPFSRARVQRVHRSHARSAGPVLEDRRRAYRQQSQHPLGAYHDPRRRRGARRLSRLARRRRNGDGRGAMAARRARPRGGAGGPARPRGDGGRGAAHAHRRAQVFAPRGDRDYGRQPQLRAIHGGRCFHPGPGRTAVRDHAYAVQARDGDPSRAHLDQR